MSGYQVDVCCYRCGSPVEHVNASKIMFGGTECSAVCRCVSCKREWFVQVLLRPLVFTPNTESVDVASEGRTHGIRQTYNAGCRCEECRAAERSYRSAYRARKLVTA